MLAIYEVHYLYPRVAERIIERNGKAALVTADLASWKVMRVAVNSMMGAIRVAKKRGVPVDHIMEIRHTKEYVEAVGK